MKTSCTGLLPASCIRVPSTKLGVLQGELPRGSVTLDTSVSGNTVYMEPQPVVALNNAEALLAGQEQEEELAILADLSRQVSTAKTFAHGRGGLLACGCLCLAALKVGLPQVAGRFDLNPPGGGRSR